MSGIKPLFPWESREPCIEVSLADVAANRVNRKQHRTKGNAISLQLADALQSRGYISQICTYCPHSRFFKFQGTFGKSCAHTREWKRWRRLMRGERWA